MGQFSTPSPNPDQQPPDPLGLSESNIARRSHWSEQKQSLMDKIALCRLGGERPSMKEIQAFADDPEVVRALVQVCPEELRFASKRLRGDSETVRIAVEHAGGLSREPVRWASKALRDNAEFMKQVCLADSKSFRYASERVRTNLGVVRCILENCRGTCEDRIAWYLPTRFINQPEAARALVPIVPALLQHISPVFQEDRELIVAAVKRDGMIFEHLIPEWRGDPEIFLLALEACRWGHIMKHASLSMRDNRAIVLQAISRAGSSTYEYASKRLQRDKDVLLCALRVDAEQPERRQALLDIKSKLRGPRVPSLLPGSMGIGAIPEDFLGDREVLQAWAFAAPHFFDRLPFEVRSDKDFVLPVASCYGYVLEHTAGLLHQDRQLVQVAVTSCGAALQFAGEALRDDREVVLAAVRQNGRAIAFASGRLRNDSDLVMTAVRQGEGAQGARNVIEAVKARRGLSECCPLASVSDRLKGDRDVVLAAVQHNGLSICFATAQLRADVELTLTALRQVTAAFDPNQSGSFRPLPAAPTLEEAFSNPPDKIVSMAISDRTTDEDMAREIMGVRFTNEDARIALALIWSSMDSALYTHEPIRSLIQQYVPDIDEWAPRWQEDQRRTEDLSGGEAKAETLTAHDWTDKVLANPSNRGLLLRAVAGSDDVLRYAVPELQDDADVVLAAIRCGRRPAQLQFASLRLRSDRDFMLQALKEDPEALSFAGEALLADREFIRDAFTATQLKKRVLCYAAPRLREDADFIKELLKRYGEVGFGAVDPRLRDDVAFIHELVETFSEFQVNSNFYLEDIVSHTSQSILGNRELMLKLVRLHGRLLAYAAPELRDDREVALAAVSQDGGALAFASERLRNHLEIVVAAVKNGGAEAFKHVPAALRADPSVLVASISSGRLWDLPPYCHRALEEDRDALKQVIANAPEIITRLPRSLCTDKELFLVAVTHDGLMLKHAAKAFRADIEIVLAAVKNNGRAIKYAAKELRGNYVVGLAAVSTPVDWEQVLSGSCALSLMPRELRADRALVLEAIRRNPMSVLFATAEIRRDREVIKAALAKLQQLFKKAAKEGSFWSEPKEWVDLILKATSHDIRRDSEIREIARAVKRIRMRW